MEPSELSPPHGDFQRAEDENEPNFRGFGNYQIVDVNRLRKESAADVVRAGNCRYCRKVFDNFPQLFSHERKCQAVGGGREQVDENACPVCKKSFVPEKLEKHISDCRKFYHFTHDGNRCKMCPYTCASFDDMMRHISFKHSGCFDKNRNRNLLWTCHRCLLQIHPGKMQNHVAVCEKFVSILLPGNKCKLCKKRFPSLTDFFSHASRNHGSYQKSDGDGCWSKKTCRYCQTTFKKALSRRKHEKVCVVYSPHIRFDDMSCKICSQIFRSVKGLYIHLRTMHLANDKKRQPVSTISGDDVDFDVDTVDDRHPTSDDDGDDVTLIEQVKIEPGTQPLTMNGPKMLDSVFLCPLCSGKLPYRRDVRRHIEVFHRVPEDKIGGYMARLEEMNI